MKSGKKKGHVILRPCHPYRVDGIKIPLYHLIALGTGCEYGGVVIFAIGCAKKRTALPGHGEQELFKIGKLLFDFIRRHPRHVGMRGGVVAYTVTALVDGFHLFRILFHPKAA